MNEEVKKTVLKEAEKSTTRTLLIAILAFFGCGLTALFFPQILVDVAVLMLIAVCFNFGVTAGIFLIAKKLKLKGSLKRNGF
ncbi:MAG: hypothetical protein HWN68_08310 [Desulfobacterales bacterium]|nr:hypothetical protein [Desulfobacterales bacterium]